MRESTRQRVRKQSIRLGGSGERAGDFGFMGQSPYGSWCETLRPEARLVLCCARTHLDAETEARIRELLQCKLDWAYLHRIASRNGQMPALGTHLMDAVPGEIPSDSAACLCALAKNHRRQNDFLLDLLCELLAQLQKAGLAALPYTETHACYAIAGRLPFRPCQWLDLVVRPEQAQAAQQVVRSSGRWHEQEWPQGCPRPTLRDSVVFDTGPNGCALSLHWATASQSQAIYLDLQEVWTRQTTTTLGGRTLPALSAEDALLHICVQHSITQWVTLAGVSDVAELLRAHPGLQWEHAVERARRAGVLRCVLLGLHLADQLLSAPLPEDVRRAAHADASVVSLAADVAGVLFHSAPHWRRTPEELKFQLRLRERAGDRARFLWRYATTPTRADLQWTSIPPRLAPLYRALRPVRLAGASLRLLRNRPLRPGPESVSGYSPSAGRVVEGMLSLADVGPRDVVYDLGCGDGRVVIEAARRFGARGVGIDLDAQRIAESQENARRAGVEHLVTFRHVDAMSASLADASVVIMYLPPDATLRLAARLEQELAPGSRIVSHNVAFEHWDKVQVCETESFPSLLYMRKVPGIAITSGTTPGESSAKGDKAAGA